MYSIHRGTVIGRSHILFTKNSQDNLGVCYIKEPHEVTIGVISDGCGEGKYSEFGSRLVVELLINEIKYLISKTGYDILFQELYNNILKKISAVVTLATGSNIAEQINFIKNHLLFTVIGFIADKKNIYIFKSGDGVILVNDDVTILNENNQPVYISYNLIDRKYLNPQTSVIPSNFDIYHYESSKIKRIAIASDGWQDEKEILLLSDIWGIEHPEGLQRKMNYWSNIKKYFQDDASIIILENT